MQTGAFKIDFKHGWKQCCMKRGHRGVADVGSSFEPSFS